MDVGGDASPRDELRWMDRLATLLARQFDHVEEPRLLASAAEGLLEIAGGFDATAIALIDDDGFAELPAVAGPPPWCAGPAGVAAAPGWRLHADRLPGHSTLVAGRTWCSAPQPVVGLPEAWPVRAAFGVPLLDDARLTGVLYGLRLTGDTVAQDAQQSARVVGAHLAVALSRARLAAEATERSRQLHSILEITADVAQRLEFSTVARHIVEGVTSVTDFRVATLSLRDGDTCRRIAASGLASPRIGLETPYHRWEALLDPAWRRGAITYLPSPDVEAEWSDIPDLPDAHGPNAWTADHSLLLTLLDPDGEIVGFLSVDEPRSGRLPSDRTIEALELFARQVQVAFVNARLYEEARYAAERDALTGLRNRRVCWTDLEAACASATAEQPLALAVVDVDDFKHVNDAHGHAVGDRCLQHVADRLVRSCRQTDTVYRVGGEEFIVLMPHTSADEAVRVLDRVGDAIRARREPLPPLSISTGIATAPAHGVVGDELFGAADFALYAAKRGGKDRTVLALA